MKKRIRSRRSLVVLSSILGCLTFLLAQNCQRGGGGGGGPGALVDQRLQWDQGTWDQDTWGP